MDAPMLVRFPEARMRGFPAVAVAILAGCSSGLPWKTVHPSRCPDGAIVVCDTGEARTSVLGLTPDGKQVVLDARDQTVWVCDSATGRETLRLGQGFPLLSPKGKLVCTWHGVTLHDLVNPYDKRVFEWRPRPGVLCTGTVALSPDEQLLAVAVHGGVSLWHAVSGTPVRMLPVPSSRALKFSPDGAILACADWKGLALVSVADARVLRKIERASQEVAVLGFSASGKSLVVKEWHIVPSGLREASAIRVEGSTRVYAVGTGELVLQANQAALLSADQTTLLVPQHDKESRILIYDLDTGGVKATIRAGAPFVTSGRLLAAPDRLDYSGGPRGRQVIGFWDATTGQKLGEVALEDRSWSCLALSPEGQLLVLNDGSGRELCVVDRLTGEQVIRLSASRRPAWPPSWRVAFSADSRKLAFSTYGRSAVVHLDLIPRGKTSLPTKLD